MSLSKTATMAAAFGLRCSATYYRPDFLPVSGAQFAYRGTQLEVEDYSRDGGNTVMKFDDLREFIAFLERKGELRRVKTPVSCELEIAEIADRVVKRGGPALLFENVAGYDIPVLINMYASEQRMAWALGVDKLDQLVERVQGLLQMIHGPPEGLINKLRTLGQLVQLGSFQPKTVRSGPCQEVVFQGEDVDLLKFPILKCWPLDGRPVHHTAPGDHPGSRDRCTKLRHLPASGLRLPHHCHALADPQSRHSSLPG